MRFVRLTGDRRAVLDGRVVEHRGQRLEAIGERLRDITGRQHADRHDVREALALEEIPSAAGLTAGPVAVMATVLASLVAFSRGRGHRHVGETHEVSGLVVGSARNAPRMAMPHAEPDWMWPPAGIVMLKAFLRPAATLSPPSVQVAGSRPPWSTSAGISEVTTASEVSGSCGSLSAPHASIESSTLVR